MILLNKKLRMPGLFVLFMPLGIIVWNTLINIADFPSGIYASYLNPFSISVPGLFRGGLLEFRVFVPFILFGLSFLVFLYHLSKIKSSAVKFFCRSIVSFILFVLYMYVWNMIALSNCAGDCSLVIYFLGWFLIITGILSLAEFGIILGLKKFS